MRERRHEYAEYVIHKPSPFEQLGGIWPIRAGQNIAKPQYDVGPRIIEWYSLHIVLSGAVCLAHQGQTIVLSEGDLFCLYPQVQYRYWQETALAGVALRMNWLAFQGEQAAPMLEGIGLSREKPFARGKATSDIRALMGDILEKMRHPHHQDSLPLLSLMYSLFALLAKTSAPPTASKEAPSESREHPGKDSVWLKKSVEFLHKRFAEGVTVSDAVEVAGVHRSHFYSAFIREFSMSPQKYVIKLRMERAAALLANPDLLITEIAQSVGYPDLYSFSRAFVHYYGLSPSRYRASKRPGSGGAR
ncbi:MAG: transcriptional regulator, AraC family [Paenibacillus sp.]|jgi:AraC-like DNA-binding protein|nr:transcriptional regulator, AraC family [Paenibacillus sp.]